MQMIYTYMQQHYGLLLEQTIKGLKPSGFIEIGTFVFEKKSFEDFYRIRTWRRSLSGNPDSRTNFYSPVQWKLHIKFRFNRPSGVRGKDV